MGQRKDAPAVAASGARKWLGNLLVAWTFVASVAVCFGSVWWQRTGEIEVLIAYLAAPAAIGALLLLMMAGVSLASRSKGHIPIEADGLRARKQRERIFGR